MYIEEIRCPYWTFLSENAILLCRFVLRSRPGLRGGDASFPKEMLIMRSLLISSLVSLLSLTGCALQSDVNTKLTSITQRIDGHDDQLGALADPEGVVFTNDTDGVINCNTDEIVNGHMTVLLKTDDGRVQTVHGWERFMVDGLSINGDNECTDSAGTTLTTERILATIGAGKVGIGGGVTVQCLTTIGENPCVLKPGGTIIVPSTPASPTAATASPTPATPPDEGTSPV